MTAATARNRVNENSNVMIKLDVAVYMVTYNHGAYIGQAIDGILNQETDFSYHLFIGEDCSSDNTRQICIDYKNRFPDNITLLLNTENCLTKNVSNTLNACLNSGAKYLMICEGDDYWIDEKKIQKQIEFLETHPEYSSCFHRVYELTGSDMSLSSDFNNGQDGSFSLLDLAKGNFISTLSIAFRNQHTESLADILNQCPVADYALHLINGQYGKYRYMAEPMAVYRSHAGGIHSGKSLEIKALAIIRTIRVLLPRFEPDVREILLDQVEKYYLMLIGNAYSEEDRDKALNLISDAMTIDPLMKDRLLLKVFPNVIDQIFSTRKYKLGSRLAAFARGLSPRK